MPSWPLKNPPARSSEFGVSDSYAAFGRHAGIDWPVPIGTPVYAAVAGTINTRSNDKYHGNVVDIKNGDKWYRAMHLSRFNVSAGQHVGVGDLIGYTGNTGLSTGPHLHFDIRTQFVPTSFGAFVDPNKVIGKGDPVEPADRGFVINRYRQILGREPSEEEVNVYKGKNRIEVYDAFLDSDEFKRRLQGVKPINKGDIINYLTDNLK